MPKKQSREKGAKLPQLPPSPGVAAHNQNEVAETRKQRRKKVKGTSANSDHGFRPNNPEGEGFEAEGEAINCTMTQEDLKHLEENIEQFLGKTGPSVSRFPTKLPAQVQPSDVVDRLQINRSKKLSNTALQRRYWRNKTGDQKKKVDPSSSKETRGSSKSQGVQGRPVIQVEDESNRESKNSTSFSMDDEIKEASGEFERSTNPSRWQQYTNSPVTSDMKEAAQHLDSHNFGQFLRSELPREQQSRNSKEFSFATSSLSMVSSGRIPLAGYSGMFGPDFADKLTKDQPTTTIEFSTPDPYYGAGSAVGYGTGYEQKLKSKSPLSYGRELSKARSDGFAPIVGSHDPGKSVDYDGFEEDELCIDDTNNFKQEHIQTGTGLKRIKPKSQNSLHESLSKGRREKPAKAATARNRTVNQSPLNTHQVAATKPEAKKGKTPSKYEGEHELLSESEINDLVKQLSSGSNVTKLRRQLEDSRKKLEENNIALQKQQFDPNYKLSE